MSQPEPSNRQHAFKRPSTVISASAAAGKLFETDCQGLDVGHQVLTVYVRCDRYAEQVFACFRALSFTGFGKKSGSGFGEFELLGPPEQCNWLDAVPGANAFVALSHFAPASRDPVNGFWRIHITHPKFHANTVANVFKGAILMLEPGSIFRTGQPAEWYGRMVPVPRPEMPNALRYGLCFAAPMVYPEGVA